MQVRRRKETTKARSCPGQRRRRKLLGIVASIAARRATAIASKRGTPSRTRQAIFVLGWTAPDGINVPKCGR
jgi:hypothetical protein